MILLDDISEISMKEILNLYRKYVGAGYTKMLSSLSFGRDIFVKAEGMYIYTNTTHYSSSSFCFFSGFCFFLRAFLQSSIENLSS